MNKTVNQLMFCVLFGFLIVSCQNTSEKAKAAEVSSDKMMKEAIDNLPAPKVEKEHPGKAVFTNHCLVCHQADGSGVPGMHPPLCPGSWAGKDPKELIAIMMKGLNGKVEVNGEVYKNFMPSQAQLTDEEIADVLSYVRSNFGNNFGPVTVDLVKKVRSGK